jgi:hypothetical protein
LDPAAGIPDRDRSGRDPLFLDRDAEGRLAIPPGRQVVVVGAGREAVRRPGGGLFLFSEEALIGVLEEGVPP